MSGPINREIDLAHDNDGDFDFGLRHEPRRACSKFPVTLTDKSGQTKFVGSHTGQSVRFLAACAVRDSKLIARRKVSGMI
jgi:hypothetical protein